MRTLRRYNLARPVGRLSGLDSRIEVFPTVLLACRMPTLPTQRQRAPAPAPSWDCMNGRKGPTPPQGRQKNDRTQTAEAYQLAQL